MISDNIYNIKIGNNNFNINTNEASLNDDGIVMINGKRNPPYPIIAGSNVRDRFYGIELDNNTNKIYVNVPWKDYTNEIQVLVDRIEYLESIVNEYLGFLDDELYYYTSSSKNPTLCGHEYIDLGLPSRTMWATCNLGASEYYEYGEYFWWGGQNINVAPPYYTNSTFTKYNDTDELYSLEMSDDAARINWTSAWRIPSHDDFYELITNTNGITLSYTYNNMNIMCRRFTSINDPSKFIILPAGGTYNYNNEQYYYVGDNGIYLTNQRYPNNSSEVITFNFSSNTLDFSNMPRLYAGLIRPVFTVY